MASLSEIYVKKSTLETIWNAVLNCLLTVEAMSSCLVNTVQLTNNR